MYFPICLKVACPLFAVSSFLAWDPIVSEWAYIVGIVAGIASMLLYKKVSPQEKLKVLRLDCSAIREQLAAYEGDFRGAMDLTGQNLRLSFRRLGFVLFPSIVAAWPVILGLFLVGKHEYVSYFLATFAAAVTTKFLFKIA